MNHYSVTVTALSTQKGYGGTFTFSPVEVFANSPAEGVVLALLLTDWTDTPVTSVAVEDVPQ